MGLSTAARRGSVAFIALFIVTIAYLTLRPGWGPQGPNCALCSPLGTTDLLLNVIVFAPMGAALAILGRRSTHVFVVAAALSGSIELLQLLVPGRTPSVFDVLSNTAGAGLGWLVAMRIHSWLQPGPAAIRRAWIATAVPALVIWGSGALLAPSPTRGPFFAHLSPRVGNLETWTGSVGTVTLDSVPMVVGQIERQSLIREALTRTFAVRIDATAGAPTTNLAALLWITDSATEEELLIGADREDLVVRVRRRAADFLFDAPDVRFPDFLAGIPAGSPLRIEIDGPARGLCARVNAVRRCAPEESAGSLWSLLRWRGHWHPDARRALDGLTLLILGLPLGMLLAVVPRPHAIGTVLALVAGVALAAAGGHLRVLAVPELSGLLLGFPSGIALTHWLMGESADSSLPLARLLQYNSVARKS